jgi:hypothetical protein
VVSLKNPPMSCKNPKIEIFAESLETLGPKIKSSLICNLRVSGGALKDAIHSYAKFIPNVSVEGVETNKKGRDIPFSGNPRGSYFFATGR